MKKFLSIVLTICMMTTMLCFAAISAQAASNDVFRISGQTRDGSLVELKRTSDYTEGWNYAIEHAVDHDWLSDNGYVRIVADLLANWNAVGGKFSEEGGDGFKWDTIFIDDEAIITLNLNGHTINRGLTESEYNGEVISIDDDADVIINGGKSAEDPQTGTIRGGYSCNGAGGIHVEEDIKIVLNNVNVVCNAVEGDCGSGIALLEGSKLIMNGGQLSSNKLTQDGHNWEKTAGTVYAEDADATFNKVAFSNNACEDDVQNGLVLCAEGDSEVILNECVVEYNGDYTNKTQNVYIPMHLFYTEDANTQLTLNKCILKNNIASIGMFFTMGSLKINECTFMANDISRGIFYFDSDYVVNCDVKNSVFSDNLAAINYIPTYTGSSVGRLVMTGCTFNRNGIREDYAIMGFAGSEIKLVDCDLGDTVFRYKENITIVDTAADNGVADKNGGGMSFAAVNPNVETGIGSVIGEGSLTMIISFLALFVSIASVGAIVVSNKKKTAFATANGADDDE